MEIVIFLILRQTKLIKEIELGNDIQALCSFSNKFLIIQLSHLIFIY